MKKTISLLLILLLLTGCYPVSGDVAGISFRYDLAWSRNNAETGKPYEDASYAAGNVFVVADGVSRDDSEYYGMEDESPASYAAGRAAALVGRVLSFSSRPDTAALAAFRRASASVGRYNRFAGLTIPAASSYVSAVLKDGSLYYSYIGDNHLMLIRDGKATEFCEKQTDPVHAAGGAAGLGMTREEYYREVVNCVREDGLGYGVVTGEARAEKFLRTGSFPLQAGDRVILSSDGLDTCFKHADIQQLAKLSAKEILDISRPYDEAPYGSYAHDKTLIVIDIL